MAIPSGGARGETKSEVGRPFAVSMLWLCLLGAGILLLVLGVAILLLAIMDLLTVSSIVLGFVIFLMVGGLVSIGGGNGIRKSASWANSVGLVLGVFYVVLGLFLAIPGTPWLVAEGGLGVVLGAFVLAWSRSSRFRSRLGADRKTG
jgi:hypothetical protein